MKATLATQLNTWTTDELLTEVLNRSAWDRPTLDHIQGRVIRALLQHCDRKPDETVT